MKNVYYVIGILLLSACSHSAPSQPIKTFGKWEVTHTAGEKNTMLCYAGAAPVKSTGPAAAKRGTPYLMVTRRPSRKLEVSTSSGYRYLPDSDVTLAIDGNVHHLFFKDSTAWARGKDEDLAIINAIKAGSVIEVHSVSAKGETSTDIYPAHGFWRAIAGIKELCK